MASDEWKNGAEDTMKFFQDPQSMEAMQKKVGAHSLPYLSLVARWPFFVSSPSFSFPFFFCLRSEEKKTLHFCLPGKNRKIKIALSLHFLYPS